MAVTAPANLKINQIYALNNGEDNGSVQFPNAWLALEWTNGQTAAHNIVVETSHQTGLVPGADGLLYANNPTARPLQSVLLPSGATRGLIPFQTSVATYSLANDRFYNTQDALTVRVYATTATENSSVVSLAVPVHASLLSVTTGDVTDNIETPISVFDYWKLQGPYAAVASYSGVTAWMPGFPVALTATASQLGNSSVCVSFPFRGEIMHPVSAPGILIPVADETHAEVHPLALPKVYEVKLATLTGTEVHSGFAYPNVETGEVAYNIPASAITVTGRYVILARGLVQYYHPSYTASVISITRSVDASSMSPAGGAHGFTIVGTGHPAEYNIIFTKTFNNYTGTQTSTIQGSITATLTPVVGSAPELGSASGVSVPAYRGGTHLSAYFNTEPQLWSTVLTLTAPVTSGGGENTNMFSWLNNDYWWLTDLQVNLGTRAVTHRHGTVQIKPNDTVQFAVLFHNGSAGKDPVATDLRLAVRSSTNASAYYFWANPSVTTTSVSGDIYYTLTVTASDEDLLAAQASGLLAGSAAAQSLLAEVQWTTTRGTFTSDTFTIEVPSEVIREPDV